MSMEMPPVPPAPPMQPSPMLDARPRSMIQAWLDAVTKPREGTFASLAASPNVKTSTAFLWVFIGSLVQSFLAFLVQGSVIRRMLEQQGLGDQLPSGGGGLGFSLISVICGAPVAAVVSVVVFAIVVALIQWVARMFGGKGTYDQLAYCFAAIAAPISIISGLFALLGAIPYVGACFGVVGGLLGLYALFLQITAAKAVNGFGWGQAAGSVLLPGLVLGLLCCCLAFGISALLGASLGNIFSSINQSLVP